MAVTRIIAIRHGQSEANATHSFAGHINVDLTELGHKQARLGAKYLYDKEKPDIIYSSDLMRAHNTAAPFSEKYGLPINDTASLRELYAGEWEGLPLTEISEKYTDDLLRWRNDFANSRCTGGESVAELYARIIPAVKELARKHVGQCILFTSHATPIRALEAYARGLGAERIGEIPFVSNSAINIFEYNDQTDTIRAIETNITAHLEASEVTSVPTSLKN